MKRSEMVKILLKASRDFYRKPLICYKQEEKRAEFILEALEQAGMLPPYTTTLFDPNNVTYESHQDYCHWEPEND